MKDERFQEIVKENQVKEKKGKHLLFAFLVGGCMGLLAHFIYDMSFRYLGATKENAGLISTSVIIILTTILTMTGTYKKLARKFGAGLFIPTSGFANSMASSAIESKFEGPIYGLGSRMFYLAGSVITYGIFSAFIYAMIRFLLSLIGVSL